MTFLQTQESEKGVNEEWAWWAWALGNLALHR